MNVFYCVFVKKKSSIGKDKRLFFLIIKNKSVNLYCKSSPNCGRSEDGALEEDEEHRKVGGAWTETG